MIRRTSAPDQSLPARPSSASALSPFFTTVRPRRRRYLTGVPLQGVQAAAGGDLPDLYLPVLRGTDEKPPVGAEGHARDNLGMFPEVPVGALRPQAPQPDRAVVRGAGQQPPVRAKGHAGDGAVVEPLDRPGRPARVGVPQ